MLTKRASLHTLGCRLNHAETAILAEGLRRKGFRLVEFGEPTDLFVLNSCSVTEDADRTSRYLIRKTLRHSPEAFVAVTGCYAQTGIGALQGQQGIDLIVGNQYKLDLPAYLPPAHALHKRSLPEIRHTRTIPGGDFELPYVGEPDSTRALLKIQDGCSVMCSFCIIPFARGRERSRTPDNILREADSLAARGYREIVLTGVNIGRYHCEGVDFCALLRRLDRETGLDRIRISSIEPTTVTEALFELMASSAKLCPYLHVPLQSGDDQLLLAMNRRYTVKAYGALIEQALTWIPNLGLGTDVMVGFPGESETAFCNTTALATDLPFSYLHVFPYSLRPGTAAARLDGSVPPTIVKKRVDLLHELDRTKRLAFHNAQIGMTVEALFETGAKEGYCFGTTPNFTRMAVATSAGLENRIVPTTVTAATDRWVFGQPIHHQPADSRLTLL
jgi:threonylcarbamoyladenosine tRNA methylthiotransferase MtaB